MMNNNGKEVLDDRRSSLKPSHFFSNPPFQSEGQGKSRVVQAGQSIDRCPQSINQSEQLLVTQSILLL